MAVWVHSLERVDAARCVRVRDALHASGIDTSGYDWNGRASYGVLIVDRIDQSVHTFVRESKQSGCARTLVVTLTRDDTRALWALVDAGAADAVAWDDRATFVDDVVARIERWRAVDALVESPVVQENLVGRSPAWVRVVEQVVEIARFTSAAVLLTGESGTGKELVARLVH